MKIGLSLSGGGFRATVFHLGVLDRLARTDRLESVSLLSTVSGGSLAAGLVLALNDFQWPSSEAYLARVNPAARRLLTTTDLQRSLLIQLVTQPWRWFSTRADDLAVLLRRRWGIDINLNQLPETPRWMINATCYETGKNWRFERFRMGDYLHGYSYDTDIPLSEAMAASAGFPGLIGPLVVETEGRSWFRYLDRTDFEADAAGPAAREERKTEPIEPDYRAVHLWDGGVYDNHGLEGIHDFIDGWRSDVDFFIVSDAAGRSKPERYRPGAKALLRIATGIMMDQIRSLRSRAIIERFVNHDDPGAFLQIGNTCAHVLGSAGRAEEINTLCASTLSEEEARKAEGMPTVIRRLSEQEFDRLHRHGFEVANYTLHAYGDEQFPSVASWVSPAAGE